MFTADAAMNTNLGFYIGKDTFQAVVCIGYNPVFIVIESP
jgi:hypothetical protein